jgi:DNA-binding winged helix-turn-helix (wHTH) protein/tetratricopeptide (TPR) repeat protein
LKTYSFGPFELLPDGTLLHEGRASELPPKQKALLRLLAASGGRLVSKQEILDRLWPDSDVSEASLTTCVHGLRLALDDRGRRGRYLETVQGRGYRFHATARGAERGARVPSPVRLAVAFAGRGATPRYLAAGLAGEVTAGLAHWGDDGIEVVARASADRALRKAGRPAALGRTLELDFVVTGTVWSSPREVRVSVELLRPASRARLWSQEFAAPASAAGLLAGEISEALAKRLLERTEAAFTPRSLPLLSADPRAYRALLRGLFLNELRGESGLRRSIPCFEQALEWDPDCSAAHVALAEVYLNLGWRGFAPPREIAPRVREALARALELDPYAEFAHAARAFLFTLVDRDPRSADEALALASDGAVDLDRSAWMRSIVHVAAGRFDEALEALEATRLSDPLSPNLGIARAFALWLGGRLEEALATARALARREPDFPAAHALHANVATLRGLHDEALRAAEKADALARGDQMTRSAVAWTFARAGRVEAARTIQAVLERRAESRYVSPTFLAVGRAGLGDTERALDWLGRAGPMRCMWLPFAPHDPRLASLRDDPRFERILADAGLERPPRRRPDRAQAGSGAVGAPSSRLRASPPRTPIRTP